jgi:hypothetical protein
MRRFAARTFGCLAALALAPHVEAQIADLTHDDPARRERAVAALLYETSPFPAADLVDADAPTRARLVRALADRPRIGAATLLRGWIDAGRLSAEHALLAASALTPAERAAADLERLVAAARADDGALRSAALTLARRLSPAEADSLVPAVVARLRDANREAEFVEAVADAMLPLLEVASPRGEQRLWDGLVDTRFVESGARFLAQRGSVAFHDAMAAAFAADTAPPAHLLRHMNADDVTADRIPKLADMLGDTSGPLPLLAFAVLTEAGVSIDAMHRFVHADVERSDIAIVGRWIAAAGEGFSQTQWRALLAHPAYAIRRASLLALAERDLPAASRELVFDLAAADPEPRVRAAAVRTIGAAGDRTLIATAWNALDESLRVDLLDAMTLRRRPFVASLLRDFAAEVPAVGDGLGTRLRVVQAQLGDADAARELLRMSPPPSGSVLALVESEIVAAATPTDADRVRAWLASDDTSLQLLAVRAAAARRELGLRAELVALVRDTADPELRSEARQSLLRGPDGADLRAPLGSLTERVPTAEVVELVYDVLAVLRPPLERADVTFLGSVVLQHPSDDDATATTFGPRRREYPIHRAILDLLRTDERVDVAPIRDAAVQIVLRGSAGRAHRVLHFLSLVAEVPELRAELGWALARLVLVDRACRPEFRGPALLLVAEAAGREAMAAPEASRRHTAAIAADAYAAALRAWLDAPPPDVLSRAFLGTDDPVAERRPLAALAADARRFAARAATDVAERAELLRAAEDLAFGDAEALARVRAEAALR